jgi:UDP-N-acetylmuramoyl-tripeptide--D-alanyl-D-alanine ligase
MRALLTAEPTVPAVREALRDLAVASEGKAHRTYAVLGELTGAGEQDLMDLGRFLVRLDITALVVVGAAGPVHAGAVLEGSWGQESRHVPDADGALALLTDELSADDVVLVAGLPTVLTALEGAA